MSWYVDKGLALDITPYINDPKIGLTDEDKADFPDMFMKDCIWGDGQYAMPFNKELQLMQQHFRVTRQMTSFIMEQMLQSLMLEQMQKKKLPGYI